MVSCCTYHITYGKQKQANKQDIGYPITVTEQKDETRQQQFILIVKSTQFLCLCFVL